MVKLGQLPARSAASPSWSVSALTADEVDGALAMLREHAPQGLDSGFEDSSVAGDSLRYVLERSPTECAEALLLPSPHCHPSPSSSPKPNPNRGPNRNLTPEPNQVR